MIVPAIGVVVRDDHRHVFPLRQTLQTVERLDEELLLRERIGVRGVSILIARRLEEADGRQIAAVRRRPEVGQIVLVTGLTAVYMARQPDVYESLSRVQVDSETAGRNP